MHSDFSEERLEPDQELETPQMAHVLFMDIVSYSLLPMDHQREVIQNLQQIVHPLPDFQQALSNGELISLPTGDGMALAFLDDPTAPMRCARQISLALKAHGRFQVRMGIHSGPIYRLADINANANVAGGGINLAQRVMGCGDGGHVLISKAAADILTEFSTWHSVMHDLGEHPVKHGARIQVFNAFDAEFGNPQTPSKLQPPHRIFSFGIHEANRDAAEGRNRIQMIRRVRHDWIDGVLHKSLWNVARLEPGLTLEPAAVESALVLERPLIEPRVLPPRTRISEVYDQQVGQLLILGAAGTGKTTALLELAQELLDRAEGDDAHPIPVVLNLSSWPRQRGEPFTKWLVSELNYRYDVPRKTAERWVANEFIMPLLDGLDEVPQGHRVACVRSINEFRSEHGLLPLIVCSRGDDYRQLESRLRLPGAVILQPLTKHKVKEYLAKPLPALESLREAVRNDPGMYDLFDTPLMLAVGILGLSSSMALMAPGQSTLELRRARLFRSVR